MHSRWNDGRCDRMNGRRSSGEGDKRHSSRYIDGGLGQVNTEQKRNYESTPTLRTLLVRIRSSVRNCVYMFCSCE